MDPFNYRIIPEPQDREVFHLVPARDMPSKTDLKRQIGQLSIARRIIFDVEVTDPNETVKQFADHMFQRYQEKVPFYEKIYSAFLNLFGKKTEYTQVKENYEFLKQYLDFRPRITKQPITPAFLNLTRYAKDLPNHLKSKTDSYNFPSSVSTLINVILTQSKDSLYYKDSAIHLQNDVNSLLDTKNNTEALKIIKTVPSIFDDSFKKRLVLNLLEEYRVDEAIQYVNDENNKILDKDSIIKGILEPHLDNLLKKSESTIAQKILTAFPSQIDDSYKIRYVDNLLSQHKIAEAIQYVHAEENKIKEKIAFLKLIIKNYPTSFERLIGAKLPEEKANQFLLELLNDRSTRDIGVKILENITDQPTLIKIFQNKELSKKLYAIAHENIEIGQLILGLYKSNPEFRASIDPEYISIKIPVTPGNENKHVYNLVNFYGQLEEATNYIFDPKNSIPVSSQEYLVNLILVNDPPIQLVRRIFEKMPNTQDVVLEIIDKGSTEDIFLAYSRNTTMDGIFTETVEGLLKKEDERALLNFLEHYLTPIEPHKIEGITLALKSNQLVLKAFRAKEKPFDVLSPEKYKKIETKISKPEKLL